MRHVNWGGGASHERGREKLDAVIRWLAWFDYSDYATLARMLKVSERGQAGFFARLRASGFAQATRVPGMRCVLLGLTADGFERARILLPELPLTHRRVMPAWVTLVHSLSIQQAVLRREDQLSDLATGVAPEKALAHLRAVRLPDVVLAYASGERVALEIELNHKSDARVYHTFMCHLKNIQTGKHYSRVAYIFPSEALANLYRRKFEATPWPLYQLDTKTRKVVRVKPARFFEAEGVVRSGLFEFLVEGAYAL